MSFSSGMKSATGDVNFDGDVNHDGDNHLDCASDVYVDGAASDVRSLADPSS